MDQPIKRRNQKKNKEQRIRTQVIERDGLICCYCEKKLTLSSVTMEHIVPVSRRGTFNTTNLTVSCFNCNNDRGKEDFFSYCKNFNFSSSKINKYKKLYFDNLKIKVLNIAKEECMTTQQVVPQELIHQACQILRISDVDFSSYKNKYSLEIDLLQQCDRKKIKFSFEKLIKLIESETI